MIEIFLFHPPKGHVVVMAPLKQLLTEVVNISENLKKNIPVV